MLFSPRFPWLSGTNSFILLCCCWAAINIGSFSQFGIVTGFEATKYIRQANLLLAEGNFESGNYIFYSIPILIIAFSKVIGSFPWFVVAVQLMVNALSLFYFYRLNLLLTKNHTASSIATFLLVTMFYYQLYNVYLFTESLYFSFSILYTCLLFSIRKPSIPNMALLLVAVSMLYFTRPTGVFFIPATILYLLFRFYSKKTRILTALGVLAAVFILYLLLNVALPSGGEFNFLLPYRAEHVICGVPTNLLHNSIEVPGEKNSVEGLWYIVTHHTDLFLDLAGRRLAAFFGVTRPHYSTWHNLYLIIYFWPAYLVIAFSLGRLFRNFLPQSLYLFSSIFFIMVTVMLSCDEWHNRFILALLPFFLLLAFAALFGKPAPGNAPAQ